MSMFFLLLRAICSSVNMDQKLIDDQEFVQKHIAAFVVYTKLQPLFGSSLNALIDASYLHESRYSKVNFSNYFMAILRSWSFNRYLVVRNVCIMLSAVVLFVYTPTGNSLQSALYITVCIRISCSTVLCYCKVCVFLC